MDFLLAGIVSWTVFCARTQSQHDLLILFLYFVAYYNSVITMMDGKLNRQQLIKVMNQLEIIQKLPKPLLDEFCRIFKVEESNSPHSHLIQQFKNKMADIFIQEADGYLDYLQLPKFRALGAQLTQKMNQIFQKVWNQYGEYQAQQQSNAVKKEIQLMLPNFSSNDKMEQFHLKLLQLYKESPLFPKNNHNGQLQIPEPKPAIQNQIPTQIQSPFLFPNSQMGVTSIGNLPPTIQPGLFPMYPFSQTPAYPKVQAQDGFPYIIDNQMVNHNQHTTLYNMPRFISATNFYPPQGSIFPELKKQPEKPVQKPIKNVFKENLQLLATKFLNYEFIQCVCQGKKNIESKLIFKCGQCYFSYHLNCLKIDNLPSSNSLCPLCILRKQTIFCKVTHQPIKFNWHLTSEKGRQLKVETTMQESNQIHDARKNGLDCQIRFLKINGKSLKKQKKPMDGYNVINGLLQKTAKHTEITLPELVEDRHQPISLEIVLRSEEEGSDQPKLYLFAVFLITIKKIDEVVEELFQSKNFVTRDYHTKFKDEEGKVKINLKSQTFGREQILFPVRGQQCDHIEVFDIKKFLETVNEFKKDTDSDLSCPVCSNTCNYFIYDKEVYNAIQKQSSYESKKPQTIIFDVNGLHQWDYGDFPDNESEGRESQRSNEMDVEKDQSI